MKIDEKEEPVYLFAGTDPFTAESVLLAKYQDAGKAAHNLGNSPFDHV